jgi:hypothetical protein
MTQQRRDTAQVLAALDAAEKRAEALEDALAIAVHYLLDELGASRV